MAPAPTALLSSPTPELPRSRTSKASTTSSTSRAPTITYWTVSRPTESRGSRSRARVLNPPSAVRTIPASRPCRPPSAGARPGTWLVLTPVTSSPEQASSPAITANTAPGPLRSSSSAATAGPARTLTLSVQLEATLAAVSSSGVRARVGRMAFWAGRVTVIEVAARAARP
jgi:hypothetical protein